MSAAIPVDKTNVSVSDREESTIWHGARRPRFVAAGAGAVLALTLALTLSFASCKGPWTKSLPVLTSVSEIRKLAPTEITTKLREIREQLNCRREDGVPGVEVMP